MPNHISVTLTLLLVILAITVPDAMTPAASDATQSWGSVPGNATPVAARGVTINVMAAASLAEPFVELEHIFEATHPVVNVELGLAGSHQLAYQLASGAPADVFASANKKYIDTAIEGDRVGQDDPRVFVKNRLTVIVPATNPGGLRELQDLAIPGIKLVLAAREAPVGQYSLDFLANASQYSVFGTGFADAVLRNVVSYEHNVKAVVAKIMLGEADAGIVYVSDAAGRNAQGVIQIAIPEALNVVADYQIAVVKDSPHPELAQAWVDMVLSPIGQHILAKYGYIPVVPRQPGD
jgi:molybdate transport system substrate-binding protein